MSQQINLYNAAFVPPREWVTAKSLATSLAAVLAVVVVSGVAANWHAARSVQTLKAAQAEKALAQTGLDAAKAAAQARKPSEQLQAEVSTARARIALRGRILEATQLNLATTDGGYSRYLAGLAQHAVPGLWLTQIGIDAAGAQLSLAGQTLRQEAVPDYVRRLKDEPVFAGKSFAGLEMTGTEAPLSGAPAALVAPAAPTALAASKVAVSPALTSRGAAAQAPMLPISFRLLAARSDESGSKTP
jgi:MSHA biogenesis protein MshI